MSKPSSNKNSSLTIGYVLVSVGIGLILIGLSWKQLVPAETFWSEEDAKAYAAVAEAAHAATISEGHDHKHSHSHGEESSTHSGMEETPREQFEIARESLIRAKSAHHRWGQYLSALGAIVAFAGMTTIRRQA